MLEDSPNLILVDPAVFFGSHGWGCGVVWVGGAPGWGPWAMS